VEWLAKMVPAGKQEELQGWYILVVSCRRVLFHI
jgi:hypothetical protein